PAADPSAYVRTGDGGIETLNLLVDGVHCGHCIQKVESGMRSQPGVVEARVNLSTRRMTLSWEAGVAQPGDLISRLDAMGYPAVPFDPDALRGQQADEQAFLLRCLAVAAFASSNVMLLSVAIWAGAFSDMESVTRGLLHWVSALIALPAIAYAGRPFFRAAVRAISARRVNMDVPISVAVIVTAGVSLFETINGGPHAYFDAAIMLLFFLLIGRYLDMRTRGAMRSTAENLAALAAHPAIVVDPDGTRRVLPARAVTKGMTVSVATGDRVPVDGAIATGQTTIDSSLLTGETDPVEVAPGDTVFAGTLNIGAAIQIKASATGDDTVLADIVRLVENAEQGRSVYVRLADRAARLYAPVVHLMALATLLGWWGIGGISFHAALLIAVAVLIITCPCALGLAVPAVQVVASGRLMKAGILVKTGDALERLAVADTVVLDKTGTLTRGRPEITNLAEIDTADLQLAASLAVSSRHPLCAALVRAAGPVAVRPDTVETAGMGLASGTGAGDIRLGNRAFCGIESDAPDRGTELWLSCPGSAPVRFTFADGLRPDSREFVDWLRAEGFAVEILSGDRADAVAAVATALGIDRYRANVRPDGKVARLAELEAEGRKVFMIGDGLNDAPSLAGAFVSASPASGADIAQTAADFVFQSDRLVPVATAILIARRSRRMVTANFGLAAGYNVLAVPLAVAGLVTPLIAAVAMSASSILVTLNALRLARMNFRSYR
ncbi:MAG: Cu2+-exporting ATPase, partial [Alphaproteobacteria bacterium]